MRPPFFAFYPADFANDINVEAMSTLQVGAYTLLLCKAWQADPPASLPDDDQILARFARVDAATWREIKAGALVPFRLGSDGRLHSKRLRKEYDEALSRMKANRERTKKARQAKGSPNPSNPQCPPVTEDVTVNVTNTVTPLLQGGDWRLEIGDLKTKTKTPLPPETGGGTDAYPRVAATGNEDAPRATPRPRKLATIGLAPTPDFDPIEAEAIAGGVIAIEPWDELIREWVAARLPGWDAPRGIQRSANRAQLWQERLSDDEWRASWRQAVRRAGTSKACRKEDPNFMTHGLRIDTFLREEDMVARILEGEFDRTMAAPGSGKPGKESKDEEFERLCREQDERNANDPHRRRAS